MKRGGEVGTGMKTGLKVAKLGKYKEEYGGWENLGCKKFCTNSAITTGATAKNNAIELSKRLTVVALKRETPGT